MCRCSNFGMDLKAFDVRFDACAVLATSNIPLSTPDHVSNSATTPGGSALRPAPSSRSAPQSPTQSKLDSLRAWSFNTYKFTRQLLSERIGRGTRTVDAELEAQIELLRDTQLKYANILRLARALTAHFYQVCWFTSVNELTVSCNLLYRRQCQTTMIVWGKTEVFSTIDFTIDTHWTDLTDSWLDHFSFAHLFFFGF